MNSIDLNIPNRLVLWYGCSIIITSRTTTGISYFIGNCIIAPFNDRRYEWYKNKKSEYIFNRKRLLPTLPPILTFKIYNNELY